MTIESESETLEEEVNGRRVDEAEFDTRGQGQTHIGDVRTGWMRPGRSQVARRRTGKSDLRRNDFSSAFLRKWLISRIIARETKLSGPEKAFFHRLEMCSY
jgi:hypothetical protein